MVWTLGTFPAYLAATRAIIGDRIGYLLAAAFPAVLANAVIGQNGFLTAALIGGTLVLMERRPILAGVLLGLLTYKPHLGLLFPVALIAGRHWRVFVTAAVAAMLMAAASWLAFGTECWQAFFASIGHSEQAFLSQGHGGLAQAANRVRPHAHARRQRGAGLDRASRGRTHRRRRDRAPMAQATRAQEIKSAALGCGVLLATPYLYAYDLVVLAVPLAFLFRLGRTHGFLQHELAGIGLACLLVLIFPFVKLPVGFGAVLIVAALIARRVLAPRDTQATEPDATRLLAS